MALNKPGVATDTSNKKAGRGLLEELRDSRAMVSSILGQQI